MSFTVVKNKKELDDAIAEYESIKNRLTKQVTLQGAEERQFDLDVAKELKPITSLLEQQAKSLPPPALQAALPGPAPIEQQPQPIEALHQIKSK